MALLTCRDLCLHFGPKIIFDKVNLVIEPGERICLVGQNGVGKSTLFKVLQGKIELDSGEVVTPTGLKLTALGQDVPEGLTGTVFDVVFDGLGEVGDLISRFEDLSTLESPSDAELNELHELTDKIDTEGAWDVQQKVHQVISILKLNVHARFEDCSGGLKRRILLAKALVGEPDILLLDEPTNHLDIAAVEWLENFLPRFAGAILFITHDRTFLENTARRIIELDRGVLQSFEGRFSQFLTHKEKQLEDEKRANAEFDKKLAAEEVWIRQGIKARRTRNEGRVRALMRLREEHAARRKRSRNPDMVAASAEQSVRKVIDAVNISYAYDEKDVFKKFSILVTRGDKIGILGPNGCGKTTLLNVLLDRLPPYEGTIKYGLDLKIAYADQMRDALDPNLSIIDNIAEGSEFLNINDKQMHVYSYLRRFLFSPERAREKVGVLSGGERNRCLLAKLMSKPSNVLVLDEPTNDLDMDSLELLEDLLVDYPGTLLIVSHDRTFLDNVVTSTIAFDEDGVPREYVGGYQDWLRQRVRAKTEETVTEQKQAPSKPKPRKKEALTIPERKRLAELPEIIHDVEAKIEGYHAQMADPAFYNEPADLVKKTQDNCEEAKSSLVELYNEWEKLENKREG